jgi:hypothetical protein
MPDNSAAPVGLPTACLATGLVPVRFFGQVTLEVEMPGAEPMVKAAVDGAAQLLCGQTMLWEVEGTPILPGKEH